MKKSLLICGLLAFGGINAQDNNAISDAPCEMNIVKTNITGLIFKNVNLTYERVLNKTFSISLGGGIIPNGNIPYSSNFNFDDKLENMKLKGSYITLEPRMYLGKGYGKGFYFAPYYRYSTFNLSEIELDAEGQKVFAEGETKAHNAGLMLGAQWFLGKSKNFVLDAWFIGAHYGKVNGTLDAVSDVALTQSQQNDLENEINNLDVPIFEHKATVNQNGAKVDVSGPWAGLRAGVSLGYRF